MNDKENRKLDDEMLQDVNGGLMTSALNLSLTGNDLVYRDKGKDRPKASNTLFKGDKGKGVKLSSAELDEIPGSKLVSGGMDSGVC